MKPHLGRARQSVKRDQDEIFVMIFSVAAGQPGDGAGRNVQDANAKFSSRVLLPETAGDHLKGDD